MLPEKNYLSESGIKKTNRNIRIVFNSFDMRKSNTTQQTM